MRYCCGKLVCSVSETGRNGASGEDYDMSSIITSGNGITGEIVNRAGRENSIVKGTFSEQHNGDKTFNIT